MSTPYEEKTLKLTLEKGQILAEHPQYVRHLHAGWELHDVYGTFTEAARLTFVVILRRHLPPASSTKVPVT